MSGLACGARNKPKRGGHSGPVPRAPHGTEEATVPCVSRPTALRRCHLVRPLASEDLDRKLHR